MRFLGLDIGKKRIGVAISDDIGLTATAHSFIKVAGRVRAAKEVLALAIELEADKIVVGMPMNMDGSHGEMAKYVHKFINVLSEGCDLEIVTWDERLSTSAATKLLIEGGVSRAKRKLVVDKVAATYILQGYLDSRGSGGS